MRTDLRDDWPLFFKERWRRAPCVIEAARSLVTASEAFDAVVDACDALRSGESVPIKLLLDGRQLVEGLHDQLPLRSDKSLQDYEARIDRQTGCSSVSIYCASFQRFNSIIYDRACDFLDTIYAYTGLPGGFVEAELFMGRYQATPGGIHRESCTNFHQIIEGSKTIYTWPPAQWSAEDSKWNVQVEAVDENEEVFLDNTKLEDWSRESTMLSGGPGAILYWPDQFWHVGASARASLSVNLAFYPNSRGNASLEGALRRCLGHSGKLAQQSTSTGKWTDVTLSSRCLVSAVKDVVESEPFEAEVAAAEISRITGHGFREIPTRRQVAPKVRVRTEFVQVAPVAWMTVGNLLVYGGRGYSDIAALDHSLLSLLEGMGRSQADQRVSAVAVEAEACDAVMAVLQALESMGVVQRVA